jgi:hypothetical protein
MTDFLRSHYENNPSFMIEKAFERFGIMEALEEVETLPSDPKERNEKLQYLHIGAMVDRIMDDLHHSASE